MSRVCDRYVLGDGQRHRRCIVHLASVRATAEADKLVVSPRLTGSLRVSELAGDGASFAGARLGEA